MTHQQENIIIDVPSKVYKKVLKFCEKSIN